MVFGEDSIVFLSVFAIFVLAGAIKGVLGFGLPIISMSILPFVMPVEPAIVLSAVVQPATNVLQLVSSGGIRKSVEIAWPVLLTLIPGISIGAWYLTSLNSNTLLVLVGCTIVVVALLDLLGLKFAIPKNRQIPVGLFAGIAAGISGALTALNGWVFILFLLGLGVERQAFRSAIALLFLVSGFLISSSFWILGWLNWQTMVLCVFALLGAFPGMSIGNWIGNRLPADLFRRLILGALVCIGMVLVVQGFAGGPGQA